MELTCNFTILNSTKFWSAHFEFGVIPIGYGGIVSLYIFLTSATTFKYIFYTDEDPRLQIERLAKSITWWFPENKTKNFNYCLFLFQTSLPPEDYERLCNFILQELDMALNHTHDTLKDDTKNEATKSATKTLSSTKKLEENGDLLDGRTLLETVALLVMLVTRMKIKG